MMTGKNINELYDLNRFISVNFITLLLYFPFGILLMVLRGFLGIQVFIFGLVLPNIPIIQTFLCKLLCIALGITVNIETPHKTKNVKVYISNYISPFDQLVVHSVTGSVMPGKEIFNTLLSTVFGFRFFGYSIENFSNFKKKLSSAISEGTTPVHIQPEGKQTNGKAVLKFKQWPFELCNQVQPVSIEVNRPILGAKVSAFNSTYWADTIWYLLSPYTSYTLRFLPIIDKMDLPDAEFAEKVQQEIAAALKVQPSKYCAADLLEWEKRIIPNVIRRDREGRQPSTPTYNSDIHRMARQIKEVLPIVPYGIILSDLNKTQSIDQTITNLLEGHVPYVPEVMPPTTPPVTTPSTVKFSSNTFSSSISLNTAASTFGKSAQERMLSFQERKQQLIESARQRYIEKHGLNIIGSS